MILEFTKKIYMQIEQFDTGLKGQENVKKLVITPEENYNNKQRVRHILNTLIIDGKNNLNKNLKDFFDENVKVNCFHPINEFTGIKTFEELYWNPIFNSFPDIERREKLVIGGTFRDKVQVGSISNLSGIFKKSFHGIKPNNKMINLKLCEIH